MTSKDRLLMVLKLWFVWMASFGRNQSPHYKDSQPSHMERPSGRGTETFHQQPAAICQSCELVTFVEDPSALVKSSDHCSPT